MLSRKRSRPTKSSATGTWKPRKKRRLAGPRNLGLRTGGFAGLPGSRGELKWVDTFVNGAINVNGSATLINGIVPGTGASQRVGRKVVMRALNVKIALGCGVAGATPFRGKIACSIVYDMQANSTAAAVSDIYSGTGANQFMNLDNRGRFKVLWRRNYYLDQSGGLGAAGADSNLKLMNPVVFNSGTAGTVADIMTGALYFVVRVANAASTSATTQPDLEIRTRVRYSDD